MIIESNNPNKPKKLCYGIAYKDEYKTTFGDDETNVVMSYNYYLQTNDNIPPEKFLQIEIAIAKIMNPERISWDDVIEYYNKIENSATITTK